MFVKVFSHNNVPTFFEVINCFSMIDGHVRHIMKVLEDYTLHLLHIFDFLIPHTSHALKTCQQQRKMGTLSVPHTTLIGKHMQ
jgi:hypothetical protein